jgi:hypothetical protein
MQANGAVVQDGRLSTIPKVSALSSFFASLRYAGFDIRAWHTAAAHFLIRHFLLVKDHPASRPSGLLSFERSQLRLVYILQLECRHYHYIDHLVYFSPSAKDFFLSE